MVMTKDQYRQKAETAALNAEKCLPAVGNKFPDQAAAWSSISQSWTYLYEKSPS
jgi:hypothetical protein